MSRPRRILVGDAKHVAAAEDDGELVVNLVGRVAVEDYTCGAHRLLSLDRPVTPP
jgi:hypothetical protein